MLAISEAAHLTELPVTPPRFCVSGSSVKLLCLTSCPRVRAQWATDLVACALR